MRWGKEVVGGVGLVSALRLAHTATNPDLVKDLKIGATLSSFYDTSLRQAMSESTHPCSTQDS